MICINFRHIPPEAISVDASGWSPYVNGIADFCPTDRGWRIHARGSPLGFQTPKLQYTILHSEGCLRRGINANRQKMPRHFVPTVLQTKTLPPRESVEFHQLQVLLRW